ncbi:hypothetical protein [Methylocaldum sp.]|uniref:hypothetical protein n=1 Tax=Methylocaldum sp. TaxID=1969727 RepID=UPI002D5C2E03|nr:hypothetical protein [Methylocaldum sp.]HYE37257.1 hypothetical protein [Methylocaldum sp.]
MSQTPSIVDHRDIPLRLAQNGGVVEFSLARNGEKRPARFEFGQRRLKIDKLSARPTQPAVHPGSWLEHHQLTPTARSILRKVIITHPNKDMAGIEFWLVKFRTSAFAPQSEQ